jgi:hypothetical protein
MKKGAQDFIRQKFSRNGKLRSDNTSLRDFLEKQSYRHIDVKLIGVELRWLRQLWEHKNVSSKSKIEDKRFREMKLRYEYEKLMAMGFEGEKLKNLIDGYRRRDAKFDKYEDS